MNYEQLPPSRRRWSRLRWAIPTSLSAVRLVLAIAFPFLGNGARIAAVILGALSDGLDGFAARQLRSVTWWGGFFDGLLDKLFSFTVLATFVHEGKMSVLAVLILLSRDLAVAGILANIAERGIWSDLKRLKARLAGKLATVTLFGLFLAVLALSPGHWLREGFYIVTAVLSLLAAADYIRQARRVVRQRG